MRVGKSTEKSEAFEKRGRWTLKVSFSGRCLLIPKYFWTAYDYTGKADLSKAFWNPKRNLGVTPHFLEIIKQQYL